MPEVEQLSVKEVRETTDVSPAQVKQLATDINEKRKEMSLPSLSTEYIIYAIKHNLINFTDENFI